MGIEDGTRGEETWGCSEDLEAMRFQLLAQDIPGSTDTVGTEAVEETGGLTLIDSIKLFNEISRLAILWNIRHRWPAEARFALNCHRHEAMLVIRRPEELFSLLWIREGFTQGYTILVFLYGIALLPL